jgi:hypothetical protein
VFSPVVTGVILAIAAGCGPPPPAASPPAVPAAPEAPDPLRVTTREPDASAFAGSAACKQCHAEEFHSHSRSYHAATLRAVTARELGGLAPPPGKVEDTSLVLARKGDSFEVSDSSSAGVSARLRYAFGSGKTGMTFAAMAGGDGLLEISRSYFPSARKWYVTPGQDEEPVMLTSDPLADLGRVHRSSGARQCLLCHTTIVAKGSLTAERRFFGVGCESCHGPARRHAEAMRSGDREHAEIARLGEWSAEKTVQMCGRCHRASFDMFGEEATNRFQALGLLKSRCYVESGGRLSCLNCHDPHANASKEVRHYEAACLSCHSGTALPAAPPTGQGKVCPVNATSGCTGCHMPKKPVFPLASVKTQMADHFIHIPARERR